MLGKRGTEFSMSEEVGWRWTNEYLSSITHRQLFPEYQCVSVKQCDDLSINCTGNTFIALNQMLNSKMHWMDEDHFVGDFFRDFLYLGFDI